MVGLGPFRDGLVERRQLRLVLGLELRARAVPDFLRGLPRVLDQRHLRRGVSLGLIGERANLGLARRHVGLRSLHVRQLLLHVLHHDHAVAGQVAGDAARQVAEIGHDPRLIGQDHAGRRNDLALHARFLAEIERGEIEARQQRDEEDVKRDDAHDAALAHAGRAGGGSGRFFLALTAGGQARVLQERLSLLGQTRSGSRGSGSGGARPRVDVADLTGEVGMEAGAPVTGRSGIVGGVMVALIGARTVAGGVATDGAGTAAAWWAA